MTNKKIIIELEEICKRLQPYLTKVKGRLHKKLSREKIKQNTKEYDFYLGKLFAYTYVLRLLGDIEFVEKIGKIRGWTSITKGSVYDRPFDEFCEQIEKIKVRKKSKRFWQFWK